MEKNGNSDQIVINPVEEQNAVLPEPEDKPDVRIANDEELRARIEAARLRLGLPMISPVGENNVAPIPNSSTTIDIVDTTATDSSESKGSVAPIKGSVETKDEKVASDEKPEDSVSPRLKPTTPEIIDVEKTSNDTKSTEKVSPEASKSSATPEQLEVIESIKRRKLAVEDRIIADTRLNGKMKTGDKKELTTLTELLELSEKIINPVDPESLHEKPLEDMTTSELRAKWMDAIEHEDKTTQEMIDDVIKGRFEGIDLSEEQRFNWISRLSSFIKTGKFDYEVVTTDTPPLDDESLFEVPMLPPKDTEGDTPEENPVPNPDVATSVEGDNNEGTSGPENPKGPTEEEPPRDYLLSPAIEDMLPLDVASLDTGIDEFARQSNIQRSGLRRFLGYKEKKLAYDDAAEVVRESRESLIEIRALQIELADRQVNDFRDAVTTTEEEINSEFDSLILTIKDFNNIDQPTLDRLRELETARLNNEGLVTVLEDRIRNREAELECFRMDSITYIQEATARRQLELRIEKHPKLAKINDYIQKHPKTRIAVGLGIGAMGVVGAVTANPPLIASAILAGSTLRAYGSYNLVRGVGDMMVRRRLNKTEVDTIDELFNLHKRNLNTESRSRRAATLISAIAAFTPVLSRAASVASLHHAASGLTHNTNSVVNTPTVKPLVITPTHPTTLPWDYGMNNLNTNISAPDMLDKITNNPYGIKFIGNGLGGGKGAIEAVIYNGQQYTDLGHINGAIAYILNGGGR